MLAACASPGESRKSTLEVSIFLFCQCPEWSLGAFQCCGSGGLAAVVLVLMHLEGNRTKGRETLGVLMLAEL